MSDDLDDLSGVPRYLQVARVIEAEIKVGQWTPGNAAPSRNQLAERFGIARETAARAHAWLARAGYLVRIACWLLTGWRVNLVKAGYS